MKKKAKKPPKSKQAKQTPVCAECASVDIVPIIQGIPTADDRKALNRGAAVLANREEWEGVAEWHCKTCGCDWSGEWRRYKRPRT